MKQLLLATSALALSLGSASAQDAPYDWSGAYVGVQAGYGWSESHFEVIGVGNYADPDPDGFLGGIYAGFNHQFTNMFVIGIEADIAFADVTGSGPGRGPDGSVFVPSAEISSQVEWTGALRARAGYAVDRLLPYVAGGVAFGKYEVGIVNIGLANSEKRSVTGWTLGAGVDYAFSDNLIGRFEYRYTDFGHDKWFFDNADISLKSHDLRLGIAYKF